ncbi:cytochrome P450 [Nocardia sp. NPDC051570]|uniref:cytochrome P450 n=1 Tax=Nocardia sp. NPDC051570 TaxID=3364324 RepID=UPI0037986D1D
MIDGETAPGFPLARTCPFRPPEERAELRERRDPRFPMPIVGMDATERTRARAAIVAEFTARLAEPLRPRIQEIVDRHIDHMLAGPKPANLVRGLALLVPMLIICEILGVPYDDRDFFENRFRRFVSDRLPTRERERAAFELNTYFDELIAFKEKAPGADLLGHQIALGEDSPYDHAGLVDLAFLLLFAGFDTTSGMISLGALALIERPELRERIAADPGVTCAVVEELLCDVRVADNVVTRFAEWDLEIGGETIRAGEDFFALVGAANHDPEIFSRPDALSVDRGTRHHLGLGDGRRQHLARVELEVTYETLVRRIPSLRLACPVEELPLTNDTMNFGLDALPVTW